MNNPLAIALVTSAISLVVLTFSIFAAAWLNQRNNERLNESLRQEMSARFVALEDKMDSRFTALEDKMNARFDIVTSEIRRLDQRIDSVEKQLNQPLLQTAAPAR